MGGKSKKLIYDSGLRKGCSVRDRWRAGCERMRLSNPGEIFAHNNAKRKKIMFSGLGFGASLEFKL